MLSRATDPSQVLQSSRTFSVWRPLKLSTGTCCTKVNVLCFASSSSLRLRDIRTRTRLGTFRMPLLQRYLFNLVSIRTSWVCIDLSTNLRISRMQRGARFLKEMPCIFLCKWMVASLEAGSMVFFFVSPFPIVEKGGTTKVILAGIKILLH